ncbi:UDP-N-acetylglucosamine 2-epimerase (non-hydrolyzing) [Pseudolabrys taiwanensis]|uniref:UDP-N-acetylglucosamine 2-epimerase (non-hydrolyzing) n=2 Tax=Pseudolabrys taiwanensis TaxID=331696 RepID=A0A346A4L0_9HYPH|nr:UDP-N-acetylglucosamine 2-epimerase (non-hydrolyzing) [Pseudolabrys taiwanensis]
MASRAATKQSPLFVCIIGTRPEVIKMAPIIRRLREVRWADVRVVAIGQHLELLDQAIADFELQIDHRIAVERQRNSIIEIAAKIMERFDVLADRLSPTCVIAQGDTTTVMASAMVAFHRRLEFIHVEAGLRTGVLRAPFPEEFNRRVVALAATLHCAPTAQAAANLRAEGVREQDCIVTGNTVIDALLYMAGRTLPLPADFPDVPKPILLTAHRRENAGAPLERMLGALRAVVERYPDVGLYFPVHPNPDTQRLAERVMSGHERIRLVPAQNYPTLVAALKASWLVVTDSGGLQEEAPALGKPVLVLRDVTERPEAVDCGAARLVGTLPDRLHHSIAELHDNSQAYQAMAQPRFPYGDGHAADRIVAAIAERIHIRDPSSTISGQVLGAGPVDPTTVSSDENSID